MYWNMKSENPIKKEGDLLLSCNPVSTFWFLVIHYFEKNPFLYLYPRDIPWWLSSYVAESV